MACPAEVMVDGRRFSNAGGLALGDVPFSTDFTRSCNTAFVALADDLPAAALPDAARSFGLGVDGTSASGPLAARCRPRRRRRAGRCCHRAGEDACQSAGDGSRRGDGPVRPVPSTRAAARSGTSDGAPVAPLDAHVADTLRSLMLRTVQEGTASALRRPATPVAAKTGTAEFGTETPPRTHAWMIGYRGEMAFAVLLEDRGAGGADAGPWRPSSSGA